MANASCIVPVRSRTADIDSIYNLNEVGAFIWERIDGLSSAARIAEAVLDEFDIEPQRAALETEQFITRLEAAGIIERTGEGEQSATG
jgi:hypothetical protein